MIVAVLGGGTSGERSVSLETAAAVGAALEASSGVVPVRVEIGSDGAWTWAGRELPPERWVAELRSVDVCFVALHGGRGEDGTVQGLLESLGVAYTGSGVGASALCMDKLQMRRVAAAAGLRLAPGVLLERGEPAAEPAPLPGGPRRVVKPRHGGSSVDVRVVEDSRALAHAVAAVHAGGDDALVEEFVPGVEVTCGVLGNDRSLEALPLVEIVPHPGRFFDFEEKYSETGAEEICPPRSVAPEVSAEVQALALRAHRELGCRGYSRSDFLLPDEGEPVFLETNTLPGLTPRSLLPQEAAAAGYDFPGLCRRIVALALEAARPPLPARERGV